MFQLRVIFVHAKGQDFFHCQEDIKQRETGIAFIIQFLLCSSRKEVDRDVELTGCKDGLETKIPYIF